MRKFSEWLNENWMKDAALSTPESAYAYAKSVGRRIPEAEEVIKGDLYYSLEYARDVIKGRWEEAEKFIEKDPKWWVRYKEEVCMRKFSEWLNENWTTDMMPFKLWLEIDDKGNLSSGDKYWLEEPYEKAPKEPSSEELKKRQLQKWPTPGAAYEYAKSVGRRVPKAEKIIMQSPYYVHLYRRDVIKGEWPEAGPFNRIIGLLEEKGVPLRKKEFVDLVKGFCPDFVMSKDGDTDIFLNVFFGLFEGPNSGQFWFENDPMDIQVGGKEASIEEFVRYLERANTLFFVDEGDQFFAKEAQPSSFFNFDLGALLTIANTSKQQLVDKFVKRIKPELRELGLEVID